MWVASLAIITAAGYLTAMALLIYRLVRRTASPLAADRFRGLSLSIGLIGTVLHAVTLGLTIIRPGGLDLGLINVISVTGWMVTTVILIAALRQRVLNLAIPLLLIGAICSLILLIPSANMAPIVEAPSPMLVIHVLLSVGGYGLLSIAAVLALTLSFQESRLRGRHPGGLLRILPPLEITERLLFQIIGLGFIGLTLALFSGLVFVENLFAQHLVHKTVLSLTAWVLFGILLWGRMQFGWRGRTAIRWTLSAFIVLALAYFGSRIVLELILGQHWG